MKWNGCMYWSLTSILANGYTHNHANQYFGYVSLCAERRKVNVLEMKCLRSLVGVSRMDRVRNEEVRRKARIERGLASREDQSIEMVWACGKNG